MTLRGKKIHKSDISIALGEFKYHAHNATFSRKAVRDGIKPHSHYYSLFIKEMNDRKSVNKRMKLKLKRIRNERYESLITEKNDYKKHKKYILECQQRLRQEIAEKEVQIKKITYNHK